MAIIHDLVSHSSTPKQKLYTLYQNLTHTYYSALSSAQIHIHIPKASTILLPHTPFPQPFLGIPLLPPPQQPRSLIPHTLKHPPNLHTQIHFTINIPIAPHTIILTPIPRRNLCNRISDSHRWGTLVVIRRHHYRGRCRLASFLARRDGSDHYGCGSWLTWFLA